MLAEDLLLFFLELFNSSASSISSFLSVNTSSLFSLVLLIDLSFGFAFSSILI